MQDHPRFDCSEPLIGYSSVHTPVIRFLCGFLLHALAKSVGLAEKFEDVGAMSEPVEQRGRQSFVAKDLDPVGKAQIGRHNHCHSLVESGAELEDQLGANWR